MPVISRAISEALVAGAAILVAIGFYVHEMNLIAPLSDEARARPESGRGGNRRVRIFFEGHAEGAQTGAGGCPECSKGLLLNPVRQDGDHQIRPQLRRWRGLKKLLPQLVESWFAKVP